MGRPAFQETDGVAVFHLQTDPGHIVLFELEHGVEGFLDLPVFQPGAIEQHHATGHAAVDQALGPRAHTAQDGLVLHVPCEQLPDIGDGENVGIDDHGAALVAHQFGRHETGRGERLQIIV